MELLRDDRYEEVEELIDTTKALLKTRTDLRDELTAFYESTDMYIHR